MSGKRILRNFASFSCISSLVTRKVLRDYSIGTTRLGHQPWFTSTTTHALLWRTGAAKLYSPPAIHNLNMARDVVDLTSSPPQHTPANAIPGEDEEDEDLKLAIALSLQQHEAETFSAGDRIQPDAPPFNTTGQLATATTHSSGNGIFGLDRRAMEAERLARLKRKREVSDEGNHTTTSRISPPPQRRKAAPVAQPKPPSTHTTIGSSISSKATSSNPTTYPYGKIFKTHAPGYPTADTMAFTDLISPIQNLKSALLSSFIWNFDWLLPHFGTHLSKINLLFVMHAKQALHRQFLEGDFEGIKNVKLCFPPMDGNVHCMHSKLMLLFYEGEEGSTLGRERCRIVVPTANLVPFDWGVGSVMENMLWVIDLPVLGSGEGGHGHETEFKASLLRFLRAQTVPDAVLTKLNRFDFSNTKDVRFVHTVGGSHTRDWQDTGLCGLGQAISSLGLATNEAVEVDFVTSSVGSLNDEFMRSIYLACQGDDGLTEYTLRNAKALPAKRIGDASTKQLVQRNAGSSWRDHFRFYFPSQSTVASSNGGPQSAGTICFSEKWWENSKFPRANMRDCVSVRDGLLMHNKVSSVATGHTWHALIPNLDHIRSCAQVRCSWCGRCE
jgi:hypothetical protein